MNGEAELQKLEAEEASIALNGGIFPGEKRKKLLRAQEIEESSSIENAEQNDPILEAAFKRAQNRGGKPALSREQRLEKAKEKLFNSNASGIKYKDFQRGQRAPTRSHLASEGGPHSAQGPQQGPSNVQTEYKAGRTTSERFDDKESKEKGVAADVYRKAARERSEASGASRARAVNTSVYEGGPRSAALSQSLGRAGGLAKNVKDVKGLIGWGILGPVGTAYVFQLVFAIISLIGFGIFAAIEEAKQNNIFIKFLNWLVDLNSFIPANTLGFVFWGLATLLVISVFIVCLLLFYFTGIDSFGTTLSFFITALCIALSMLPVTNLLPWTILWVLYIKVTSTAALFSG